MTKKYYQSLFEACEAIGVEPVSEFSLTPNRWTRGNTLKANGKKDASFFIFDDGQGGLIKNFQTGDCVQWRCTQGPTVLSGEQINEIRAKQEAYAKLLREEQLEKAHEAQDFYKSCEKAKCLHPYLKTKGLKPFSGVRMCTSEHFEEVFGYVPKGSKGTLLDPLLVIPIRGWLSGSLAIQTLQFIDPDGQKYFFYGGRKKGAFWLSEKLPEQRTAKPVLVLGEGLATVMSVVQHTNYSCIGVMVCDCGNFMAVATELRKRFPLAIMIILSDVGNGEKQAKEASQAVGAILQKPSFSADEIELFKQKFNGKKPSDWNDFYLIHDLNTGASYDRFDSKQH